LEATALRRGCARIALGHTADDQAETILFRLVRGTGVAGLAGIPYRRGAFIRPILDVRRTEVLRFATKHGLTFVEDPSNADRRYARARVRHDWLPFLARENPRVADALLFLGRDARRVARAGGQGRGTSVYVPETTVPMRLLPTLERLVSERAGTRHLSVPGGELEVRYGDVRWQGPRRRRASLEAHSDGPVRINGAGVYRLGTAAGAPGVEIARESSESGPPPKGATFDLDEHAMPLLLRRPQPGDRMRPRGGAGSRKLQDLLVDAKVPRTLRPDLPVLTTADGTILFVPGLRPSEIGRPTGGTRQWIQVRAL
jgi:tRNA(Ile)-lysidine synthase